MQSHGVALDWRRPVTIHEINKEVVPLDAPCHWKFSCHSNKLLKVIRIYNIEYRACVSKFLFVFHCNCGSILYLCQNKARYWSKIVIFIPFLHDNPLGKSGVNIFILFFSPLSQISGLEGGVNGFCKKSPVYWVYTRITHRQTDRQVEMRSR